jgi:hypothetical protein
MSCHKSSRNDYMYEIENKREYTIISLRILLVSCNILYLGLVKSDPPLNGIYLTEVYARNHRDVNFNFLIAQKIHPRYLGNQNIPMAQEPIDAIKKDQSLVLEISPKYYSTWDYSKQ